MSKMTNIIKRNSGFIIGCVIVAGASFAVADKVFTEDLIAQFTQEAETELETEEAGSMMQTIPAETEAERQKIPAFIVDAQGTVTEITETEAQIQDASEEGESSEADTVMEEAEPAPVSDKPELGYVDFWSDSILPQTAVELIDEYTLSEFNLKEVRLIRNEIFARHGRIFEDEDLQDYFSQKYWYVPYYTPEEFDPYLSSYLTEYELKNLDIISAYEASASAQ